ncbi:Acetylcholinesterase-1 [Halotydeus destructor]|nr:Acetylcholinesterase-1 [Halotydeus destructor]
MMAGMRQLAVLVIFCIFKTISGLEYVDVTTKYGVIRGQRLLVVGQEVNQFAGIPYARPPVGRLRFAKPVDTLPWSPKILDTTKHVTVYCYDDNADENESEDCLYLSLWTPVRTDQSQLLPVLLYLYGGGFRLTGGVYDDYNGSYVARYDVIQVFADFRPNVFGFFNGNRTDAPGNVGMWDQVKVIKWLADNIEAFGGDPNGLTLAGVSSGASAALILAMSPVAKPYIRNVMLISGSVIGINASVSVSQSHTIAKSLGCNTTNYVACLRKVNTSALYAAAYSYLDFLQPFYGDDLYPIKMMPALRQGRFNTSVPLITGGTKLEYVEHYVTQCPVVSLYTNDSDYQLTRTDVKTCLETRLSTAVAEEALTHYLKNVNQSDSVQLRYAAIKAYGDFVFSCPTYFFSNIVARQRNSSDVFSVFFTYSTQVTVTECTNITWPRPCHDQERFALFGSAYRNPSLYNSTDRAYTDEMVRWWTTFAKTGRPPTMGGYRWPAYQEPPLAPITPVNLDKNEKPIWPSYVEINPTMAQNAPAYKPYTDCDNFWYKYIQLFDESS